MGRALAEWIPASVRVMSGILEDQNVDFDVVLVEEFLKGPQRYREYDTFLATGMSSDMEMIKKAGNLINDWGNIFIIGGPITFDPTSVFEEIKPDVAIIGEGEKTFLKLLELGLGDGELPDEETLSNLDGLSFKTKDGETRSNFPKRFLSKEELSQFFPSTDVIHYYPFYEDILVVLEILRGCSNFHKPKRYHGKACIEGCEKCESDDLSERLICPQGIPSGCGFCSVSGLYGPPRSREQEVIVKEIKGLIDRGATKITILDPDPLDYKREELVAPMPLTNPSFPEPNYEEIEKLGGMIWSIPEVADGYVTITVRDVKATLVTDRSAELLKRYFPRSIFGIGCESGSESHCIQLGRPFPPREVLKAARIMNKHGIKPKVNFIAGLPWQTWETTAETLRFMDKLEPYVLYFDLTRFESLPKSAFDDMPSDTGPLRDENSKALVSRANSVEKRLYEGFVGERWKVVVGIYDHPKARTPGEKALGEGKGSRKGIKPKRGFRKLLGVVGYPIFQKEQLSLFATVVKISNPGEGLKSGDVKMVEITGVSEAGFRVVLEGRIV